MYDGCKQSFDKVHFGKLLKLLAARKMPAIVLHLLLDNYTRQNICTTWNDTKSHIFSALCQGVLSPLLFNVYFDEMIYKLEKSCIGCKIGGHFILRSSNLFYLCDMYYKLMYKHNYILYTIKSIFINMQHPALKGLISHKK